jgi:ribosome biogenesis GTPase A
MSDVNTSGKGGGEPGMRAGFVAIVGAPNAGKSTLVNAMVGSKVSIVSPKVQTTRMRVIGIAMADLPDGTRSQVVLVDTPGIFHAKRRPKAGHGRGRPAGRQGCRCRGAGGRCRAALAPRRGPSPSG